MKITSLISIASILFFGGCAFLDPIEKGERTLFDEELKPIGTEEYAIGDKYTEYTDAVEAVSGAGKEVTQQKIIAIKEFTAPDEGDSKEVLAWKNAAGLIAVSSIDDATPDIINSVKYGKDKYDVSSESVGVGKTLAVVGPATYGVVRFAEEMGKAAGDKIAVNGDSNSVEKTNIDNEIHANTTGDGSPTTVNTDSSAKCPSGNCDDGSFDVNDCYANPPGGYSESGTPMYSDSLSCGSYYEIVSN